MMNTAPQSVDVNQALGTGGLTTSPVPTTAPNSDGMGAKIASKLGEARQQYPGQDDAILKAFIRDNQQTHPDIVQKIQSYLGTERTNRNNNPIAVSVKTNGHNEYTSALDQAGIKWGYGDQFPGSSDMSTIKINGDPIEASRAILSNSNAVQDWYLNNTGKDILAKYGIKNNNDFKNASLAVQNEIISGIKQSEGGSSKYSATQILNSLVADNTTYPTPTVGQETKNAPAGVANAAWNGLIGAGKGLNQVFNGVAKGIANPISRALGVPEQNIQASNQASDQSNQPNGMSQKIGAVTGKTGLVVGGVGALPALAGVTPEALASAASKLQTAYKIGKTGAEIAGGAGLLYQVIKNPKGAMNLMGKLIDLAKSAFE